MKLLYLIAHQKISGRVVNFVASVAKQTGSSVTLLVAADDQKALEAAKRSIADAEECFKDLPLATRLCTGDPVEVMLKEVAAGDYDILLLNVRRRHRLVPSGYRFLSQRIINRCPIPVMLVRKHNLKFERVLICTGGQEISEPVVKLSALLAGPARLKATLLYVHGAVPSMYTGMDEIEETMEELLATETPLSHHLRRMAELLDEHQVEGQLEIRHGDVASVILQEADQEDFDLIVVGASEGVSLASLLLGNVTQQIINRAKSAVLICKS